MYLSKRLKIERENANVPSKEYASMHLKIVFVMQHFCDCFLCLQNSWITLILLIFLTSTQVAAGCDATSPVLLPVPSQRSLTSLHRHAHTGKQALPPLR